MSNISSKLTNARALKAEELKQVSGGCALSNLRLPGGYTMSGGGYCQLDDQGISATAEFEGEN